MKYKYTGVGIIVLGTIILGLVDLKLYELTGKSGLVATKQKLVGIFFRPVKQEPDQMKLLSNKVESLESKINNINDSLSKITKSLENQPKEVALEKVVPESNILNEVPEIMNNSIELNPANLFKYNENAANSLDNSVVNYERYDSPEKFKEMMKRRSNNLPLNKQSAPDFSAKFDGKDGVKFLSEMNTASDAEKAIPNYEEGIAQKFNPLSKTVTLQNPPKAAKITVAKPEAPAKKFDYSIKSKEDKEKEDKKKEKKDKEKKEKEEKDKKEKEDKEKEEKDKKDKKDDKKDDKKEKSKFPFPFLPFNKEDVAVEEAEKNDFPASLSKMNAETPAEIEAEADKKINEMIEKMDSMGKPNDKKPKLPDPTTRPVDKEEMDVSLTRQLSDPKIDTTDEEDSSDAMSFDQVQKFQKDLPISEIY